MWIYSKTNSRVKAHGNKEIVKKEVVYRVKSYHKEWAIIGSMVMDKLSTMQRVQL